MPILVASDGRRYDAFAQWAIYCESQSAWYLTLVLGQFWHIWNCRTRSTSVFAHGLFSNVVTIYGCVTEVAIMCAVIYVPIFQRPSAFQSWDLRGYFWLPQFIYGAYIFAFNEGVKWAQRNAPHGWVATHLAW